MQQMLYRLVLITEVQSSYLFHYSMLFMENGSIHFWTLSFECDEMIIQEIIINGIWHLHLTAKLVYSFGNTDRKRLLKHSMQKIMKWMLSETLADGHFWLPGAHKFILCLIMTDKFHKLLCQTSLCIMSLWKQLKCLTNRIKIGDWYQSAH